MFDWAIAGVNISLPGEGGPECASYISLTTRIYESVVVLGVALCVFIWARSNPSFSTILLCQRNGCKPYRKLVSPDHGGIETVEGLEKTSGSDEWKDKYVENAAADDENVDIIKYNRNVYPFTNSNENRLIFESLQERNKKNWLLVLLCLIWGAEIGFKFASRTMIYLLNPCHVVTAVQIYLLAAEPSHQMNFIFRIHLYFLNGAVLAFLFPNTESRIMARAYRKMPYPCGVLSHGTEDHLVCLTRGVHDRRVTDLAASSRDSSTHRVLLDVSAIRPNAQAFMRKLSQKPSRYVASKAICRLIRPTNRVYNVEPMCYISWGALSYAINMVYHFAFLQPIALISEVNLNQMLCPSQLDPFRGTYYRTAAVIHQSILCPLVAKACYLCASFLSSSSHVDAESTVGQPCQVPKTLTSYRNSCEAKVKDPIQKNSIAECKSCYEKDAGIISNVNHEIDSLNSQVTEVEKVDQNVANPLDKVNTSENQIHDSSFQLRLRKTLNVDT